MNQLGGEAAALLRFHEVMRRIHAREDQQVLLRDIARSVTEVTGFKHAVINVVRDDGRAEVAVVEGPPDLKALLQGKVDDLDEFLTDFENAEEWGLLRFLPHERFREWTTPNHVPDIDVSDEDPDAWHPYDTLYAPLEGANGELVGILCVDVPEDLRRPSQFQRDLLEMFAVQAGLAISHTRQRRSMSERVRLGEMQRQVIRQAGQLDLGKLVASSVEAIATGMLSRGATLRLFRTDEVPAYVESYPFDPQGGPTAPLLEAAGALALDAWDEHVAVTIRANGPGPEAVTGELRARGLDTLLIVPIGSGEECLGYFMAVRGSESEVWSATEAESALDLGRDLGRAVINARLFEREQQLVGRLQELNDYKRRMIATISHEMKTPLTSIAGHLELLEDGHGIGSLAAIGRSRQRLHQLTEDFLLLLRLDAADRPPVAVPLDLRDVVADAVEMVEVRARLDGIEVRCEDPGVAVVVRGELYELERVAANLLSNAVKFSRPGGLVLVECTTTPTDDGDEVSLRVTDSGLGISAEDQAQLFQEFFRSEDPEVREIGGSGLGLSIVQRIVQRHGGRVAVSSELGVGTTFTVTLPATRRVAPALS
jgi:signal transduction histidine kinase